MKMIYPTFPILFSKSYFQMIGTTISITDTNLSILAETTNNVLRDLNEWIIGNRISINIQKTFYTSISNCQVNNAIEISVKNLVIQIIH